MTKKRRRRKQGLHELKLSNIHLMLPWTMWPPTALPRILAELGVQLNKNLELVQVDSLSRAGTLASGQVDLVLRNILP